MAERWRFLMGLMLVVATAAAASAPSLVDPDSSEAVQDPKISLDMDPTGNTYDGATNTMTVGTIDSCLTTPAPGDNATHTHVAHVVIQDIEDLTAWQTRLNYDGTKMRPHAINFTPFADANTGQNISFVNIPIDPTTGVHRDITGASSIPPQAPESQTALVGSSYQGQRTFSLAADTPPKSPGELPAPSYSAPAGGVLAALTLQVLAGNAGQASLHMDLDDDIPNPPGSRAVVFTGRGTVDINLGEGDLGDGFHGEGAPCQTIGAPIEGQPPTGETAGPAPTSISTPTEAEATATAIAIAALNQTPAPTTVDEDNGRRARDQDGGGDGGLPTWIYFLAAGIGIPSAAALLAWRLRSGWRRREG